MNKEKIVKTLGLAYRAHKLSIGYDMFIEELKNVKCVFSSFKGDEDTYRKLINKCEYYNIPHLTYLTQDDFYKITGKKNVKVIALLDDGFYNLINNY